MILHIYFIYLWKIFHKFSFYLTRYFFYLRNATTFRIIETLYLRNAYHINSTFLTHKCELNVFYLANVTSYLINATTTQKLF